MRPKVLFVVNKFGDMKAKPEDSIAPDHFDVGLIASFQEADIADSYVMCYDEYFYLNQKKMDHELVEYCKKEKPDVLVMFYLYWLKESVPDFPTLLMIKNLGIPIVFVWYDGCNGGDIGAAQSFDPVIATHVYMDTSKYPAISPNKILQLWFPRDSRQYAHDPVAPREIPVSFLGTVKHYKDRLKCLEAVYEQKIPIYCNQERLSSQKCIELWKNSQITLNFSRAAFVDCSQFKTRVMEAMLTGAMLLESEGNETLKWFEPGKDYVSFKDEHDLVFKIRYYMDNPDERLAIAKCGHNRAMQQYTSRRYWSVLLRRVLKNEALFA